MDIFILTHIKQILAALAAVILSISITGLFASDEISEPYLVLKASNAKLFSSDSHAGKDLTIYQNYFGPSVDGLVIPRSHQLEWTATAIPEGDYYIAVPVANETFLGFGEATAPQNSLYHNDNLIPWSAYSSPEIVNDGKGKKYQAILFCEEPVHIILGDSFMLLNAWGGNEIFGAPRLSKFPWDENMKTFSLPQNGQELEYFGVKLNWLPPSDKEGTTIQDFSVCNSATQPVSFKMKVRISDYLQKELAAENETITLKPGERKKFSFPFKTGNTGRISMTVSCESEDGTQSIDGAKYFLDDIKDGARPATSLNGEWKICFVQGGTPGDTPPQGATWEKIRLPSVQTPDDKTHCAWYRKTFKAPSFMKGERLILKFDYVLCEANIYVNGKKVLYEFQGTEPFEADITSAFKPEQENEILVSTRDWIAYSPENQERVKRGETALFKDGMIAPSGHMSLESMGIGGPIYLESKANISIEDVFIVTSLKDKKLALKYLVASYSKSDQNVTVSPSILDKGTPLFKIPEKTVPVKAGETKELEFDISWPDPVLWQPEKPYLYVLQTDVKPENGAGDRHIQRFGFRDIWIEGADFIINGGKMKIRSQWAANANATSKINSTSEPAKRLEEGWNWQTQCIKDKDIQLSRTHNQAGVKETCDIADETGLMIKVENGNFCQQKLTRDKKFWDNAIKSQLSMVNTYKNHPSVFMWSAGGKNMWNWFHMDNDSRKFANQKQVEIAEAMRKFDLMKRPIEWEADGDLMGRWEYYQLHYPRELSGAPDLPPGAWWGPLDGKTVIPYSMGNIILGSKPITVGEAFSPTTLGHPFGETILIGDDAYLGGEFLRKAWTDSSQFLINGFRDAEFALMDVHVPLSEIKPQTIVLKEETAVFYGGAKLKRNINIHNDIRRKSDMQIKWSLSGKAESPPIVSGTRDLKLEPAELVRMVIDVDIPNVEKPLDTVFKVELSDDGKIVHSESRKWKIFPRKALEVPVNLKLAVYDPAGKTSSMLKEMGIPFAQLDKLTSPPEGSSLLIGQNALKGAKDGEWKSSLIGFVETGGKVLLLEHEEMPEFLPVPAKLDKNSSSTICFLRAGDHPATHGIENTDLRWWADDHYVSKCNFRKPSNGNWMPIVDAGSMEGTVLTPLFEEYLGKGSFLVCQMPLTDKVGKSPSATKIFQNILAYLADPAVFRKIGKTALLEGQNKALEKMLNDNDVRYDNLTELSEATKLEDYEVIVIDIATGLDEKNLDAIRNFTTKGGKVMLFKAIPAKEALLEKLLGVDLDISKLSEQSGDVQNRTLRQEDSGLMAGISNHDLFWPSESYLAEIRKEGCWSSGCKPLPQEELIAEYVCAPANPAKTDASSLTLPSLLLEVLSGKGKFLVCQLNIENPPADSKNTAGRLASLLLTNLGSEMKDLSAQKNSREDGGYPAVPILVGVTGAQRHSQKGTVVDVIGNNGLRIKRGDHIEDVFYIGVAPMIPESDPFYEKAVEAHRKLVLGKEVTIKDDAVDKNSGGQHIAYVYLGNSTDNQNDMINAQVIGEGLGEIGNFEGNNSQRTYFKNLSLTASQNKVGIWAEEKK